MKKIIITFLVLLPFKKNAQSNSDVGRSFLLHFLQENILILENDANEKKYDVENLIIDVDSIGAYYTDIVFYKFVLGKNIIRDKEEKMKISFNSSSCNEYILAYDSINNFTFRLKGFNGNDLLFLLDDIKKVSFIKRTSKKILSELSEINIGINFHELYKALINLNFDSPSLKKCSDPIMHINHGNSVMFDMLKWN